MISLRRVIREIVPNPFKIVRELIGNTWRRRIVGLIDRAKYGSTRDISEPNYQWYDETRRGRSDGLEIAGLFIKPANSIITSWALGDRPQFATDDTSLNDDLAPLNQWFDQHWTDVMNAGEESLNLGETWFVINPDLTVTELSPDVVEPIVDEDDYSQIIGWRVRENYPHPTETGKNMYIVDEYYPDVRIRQVVKDGKALPEERYPNMIGRVPIIHIPNRRSANELHGRPELEALTVSRKGVLHRYGEVLDAGILGNIRQGGRSVMEFIFDDTTGANTFLDTYGETVSRQVVNDEGNEVTVSEQVLNIDTSAGVVLAGGKIDFASPASFMNDTRSLLSILFWIIVQYSEIPEFAWGVSMDSSRASAETQLPPFTRFLTKKRGIMGKWLLEMAQVVGGYLRVMGKMSAGIDLEMLGIKWGELTEADNKLIFEVVKWSLSEGLITREQALTLCPLIEIDDPKQAVEDADAEAEERNPFGNDVNFDAALDEARANADRMTQDENQDMPEPANA